MLTIWSRGAGRLLFLIAMAFLCQAGFAKTEYRALWADIFHPGLRSKAEADVMLKTARDAGYNAIIIEVRKACDAFYNSSIEPKNSAVEAGFDPLGYIIEQAHKSPRIEVHAWLVTYRARISGDSGYKNPQHVFQQHPEWLGQTQTGKKTTGGDVYFLDPGVPQVIDYNLMVVRDLLSNYNVDGIVFDYIRYPESDNGLSNWGYNPTAIARYKRLYGKSAPPSPSDPEFNDFRRRQTYDHMRKIYAHVKAWRPNVKVGAATITWGAYNGDFTKTSAYSEIMQDWQSMALDGWLDTIMPMNYKREGVPAQARDHRSWASYLGQLGQQSGRHAINIVDGEGLNSLQGILAQIGATRNLPGIDGIATYAYAEPRAGSTQIPDTSFFQTIGKDVFPGRAEVPDSPWLTRPTEGWIKGVVTAGGKAVDGALVTAGTRKTYTDGTGFYAFARVAPGNVTVQVQTGSSGVGSASTTVQPGRVAEAPITISGK